MNYTVLRLLIFFISIAFCSWLQMATYINGDTTWLMHIGAKLFAGQKYYTDFFEVNMPMSAYIYLPAVISSLWLHISFTKTIVVYVILLSSISWLWCSHLLKRLFSQQIYIAYWLEIALLFNYFWLPAFSFAEREYLLVVFFMPYLLTTILHIRQQKVGITSACGAGILAGIGFSIKPYFLAIWLGIECYSLYKTKQLKTLYRPEALSCLLLFVLYGFSLVYLTPEYFTKILPLLKQFYYFTVGYPIVILLKQQFMYFSLLLLFTYLWLRNKTNHQDLLDLLAICLLAGLFIYLVQHTTWNYHMLPGFMVGSLMVALLLAELLPQNNLFSIQHFNLAYLKSALRVGLLFLLALCLLSSATQAIVGSFINKTLLFNKMPYRFTKTIRGQSVYVFTDNFLHTYPALDYSETPSPSLFPCLWMFAATQALYFTSNQPEVKALAKNTAVTMRSLEVNAIIQHKPAYILIELKDEGLLKNKQGKLMHDFQTADVASANHLNFFLQDQRFARLWRDYKYVGKFDDFVVYKLESAG